MHKLEWRCLVSLLPVLFALVVFAAAPATRSAADSLPPGKVAELSGVKLWYVDTGGSGVPLVLLHPNSGTIAVLEPQIIAFAAAGYRVVAFDRRGWGRSAADPASGPQPGSVAGDLDMLADHLKLDRFHLVGNAGGGFVAIDYAAWRPERLRSLVIGGSTGATAELHDVIARIEIPDIRKKPTYYLEVSPSYRAADPEGTRRWNEIDEHARQPGAQSQPLRSRNTFAKIETIAAPALVIAADADLLSPPGLMRIWASHLKSYEWAQIADAGHAMAWEQPGAYNDKVLEFLRRH